MKFAHGMIGTKSPNEEAALDRIRRADLLFGNVSPWVTQYKAEKPEAILFEYIRLGDVGLSTSWTKSIQSMGAGSIALGVKKLLSNGVDGILVDTPFDAVDPWESVKLVDEIRGENPDKKILVNFGDAWTWTGRVWRFRAALAMAAITDWHLVEVWMDLQKYDSVGWLWRNDAVEAALYDKKNLVLGLYDDGEKQQQKARDLMRSWDGRVYWSYKTTPSTWSFYPEVAA